MVRVNRRPLLEVPPLESWSEFHPQFVAKLSQGQHCLFIGPTGSGKTVAAHTLANDQRFVCVLGTKPYDEEMDRFISEGYVRIEDWPAPPSAMRKAIQELPDGRTVVRLVLWPKIKTREQLRSFRPVYAKALDEMLIDKGWTIVADEGLWLCDRNGLNLGPQLSAIAYTGRSMKVTLMVLLQRPAGVPRTVWANCAHAFVWRHGVTNDTRELASLGTEDPKAVTAAVQSLRGFDFLYLPCRAGDGWAISRVDY